MIPKDLKPIPGFPDYYAKRDGTIWSMKGKKRKMLSTNKWGRYGLVTLFRNGNRKTMHVARLILLAFVGQPSPKGMWVCHGIGGRKDDSLDNLYWGTPSRNNGIDKKRDGTHRCGEKINTSKLNELQVRIIRRAYSFRGIGFCLSGSQLAKIFHVSDVAISKIIKKEHWKHI